jgi:hypothetical protein
LLLANPSAGKSDESPSDRQTFHDFLVQAKTNAGADKERVGAFYKTAMAFWYPHWKDYSAHLENYSDLMALYRADQALYPLHVTLDAMVPERYR